MNRLQNILNPNSIAVIGASRKEGSLGKMFLEAILKMDFKGDILPVNPKAEEISGLKCYADIQSLPVKPSLAVIILPVTLVNDSLKELAEFGVKDIIVISAGFKEIGGEGQKREDELIKTVKKYGLNLLGPNCMGVFNTDPNVLFNGNFSPTLPNPGHVAFFSQSGALAVGIMELMADSDLGFSVFVSAGNKADITENDVLEYLAEDANTSVIAMYLESIDNPQEFRRIASKITQVKPIIVLKAGRTEGGHKAASSHTGALANPEFIMDGFFKQCGVIRVDTLQELFNAARAFSHQPLPSGNSVGVITNAGGPAIIASDFIEKSGLTLAKFQKSTIRKLKEVLPNEAAVNNPVDMVASATEETYKQVAEIIAKEDAVENVLLIIVKPPVYTTPRKIAGELQELIHNCSKTVLPVIMAEKDEDMGAEVFKSLNLPIYSYPEEAVLALSTMWKYQQYQQRFRKSEAVVIKPKMKNEQLTNSGQVPFEELNNLLQQYDIATAPYIISENAEDIIRFQKKQGSEIVLKIANEQIIHKTEAGLVKLGLDNAPEIESAVNKMAEDAALLLPKGTAPLYLAQRQVKKGIELVLGGKRDPLFGPIVMVGIGGIFIEVIKDVSFRIAPVNAYEAKEMLAELQSQVLLNGFRGNLPVDRDSFSYTIQQFSLLLAEHKEISEIDLNPLIWIEDGNFAMAVDMRATVQNI